MSFSIHAVSEVIHILRSNSDNRWASLFQVQKQCVKRCKECSFHTQDSAQDFEQGFFLQGTISRKDIEYQPLCHTLRFSKSEKAACNNKGCHSKKRKSTADSDLRPVHDFFYGLLAAPPILVIHCKPYQYFEEGVGHVSGKVTRLEHSLAVSSYPDRSLDPNTINWTFYHLYGVILRQGDTGSIGHYVCAFEQRQSGRWLYFNDHIVVGGEDYDEKEAYEDNDAGEVTIPLTRSQLDDKIKNMQERDWRVFMLMYRKLFQVPVRLLTRITFPSASIALQDQQSLDESGEPQSEDSEEAVTKDSIEPETTDGQEEYFTPGGECVEDEDLLDFESDSKQTTIETHGAADDEQLQGNPSDLETQNAQAEQPMPTGLPEQNVVVEADPQSSPSTPATGNTRGETEGAADDISQRDTIDLGLQTSQAEQPLATDLPTEQGVEVEADPESSTARPDTTDTENRAQADKSVQNETQVEDENEQATTSSQPTSEMLRTEVEPSVQPEEKQAKGKATKRTHDKPLDEDEDEDEETSTSVPASKKARTGAKSSTQPKKKQTKSKATKKTRKDASDDHEDEKAEKSAPSTKTAKPVVEPSTAYGGRETRSRARAKRGRDEIPDVDKVDNEQTATSKPASKKAKATKSAAPGKAQMKSKK